MTILVVEDEIKITRFIKKGLEMEHYTVETAYDGQEALDKAEINNYDLIILDIMLPKIDGITVCRKLRENKVETPIIMLTARDTVEDRVKGLDAGADDYLIKPFAFGELIARIRALLRREKTVKSTKLVVGDLSMDPATHEVFRGDKEINLSSKEYRLLDYMMRRPGQVCTRTMIGEHIWGYNFTDDSNVIDVYISYLRKKVDNGFPNKLILTVRDVGYKIADKKKIKM
ncbi:MAG: Two component transcriptional regulator, winged helix family [Candidatus Falkowbacteria bacterium GW2011_GWC2_38_22]|uniref:Two component transcriptional regulator, winged helix family n=1 Tax=Candidatus Falkowbacteria bacterium GW2011_GWE1_38_31 TaxID=1618638 RepID=A0A0G0JT38_9BACT|nr:MAG: Two component transcriptional regulator, winged helix family [Candidatus Falkowbacteria bacterium GW2011_GWF2_38_1205]KKQ60902.1 MAG: Two component transcriptional regulator, winged helix family [Candidatus Falkowbacteria bacterium GW2011_GWC2_38_22]KKQ63020.1 MAG: Two component transcriptional regulator, winged helix family [Candidatus Falkowbacteria bacterium GW2011_GWF1_38_22]KKQ65042.1 MAG: Two component transcriptional regulator, winged helix family [Candidatus Falkowbacteria bacter